MDKARKTFTEKARKRFIEEAIKPKRTGRVSARDPESSRPAANRSAIQSKWMTMFDNSKGVMLTHIMFDDITVNNMCSNVMASNVSQVFFT